MNELEEAILGYEKSLKDAGATGLFNDAVPKRQLTPYLVFNKMSGVYKYTHDRVIMYAEFVYLFKTVDEGRTRKRARELLNVLIGQIEGQRIAVPGYVCHPALRTGDLEFSKETPDGRFFQHVGAMFRIRVGRASS